MRTGKGRYVSLEELLLIVEFLGVLEQTWECGDDVACWSWETDATGLPAPKKSPEGALVAGFSRVSKLLPVLLVAAATDVKEGFGLVCFVLVRGGLLATPRTVELHADVMSFHVGTRNALDII